MPACPSCGVQHAADARFCSACGAALGPDGAIATRRMVTILFSDLTDFTPLTERLDPESLHEVIARYFSAMRAVIDRHGGRVEKYIGDAIMAIFGIPRLHEDDAVRAARCALEMREALDLINEQIAPGWHVTLHARYGICTGEVAFAPVGAHPYFALGDAVNVAQRLQAAAPTDEVLVDPQTAALLGGKASLEHLGELQLKGKSAPMAPWRLLALAASVAPPQGPASRMVGRDVELRVLQAGFDDARNQRRCRAVTVLGPAGIGKSCLVRAFLESTRESATAVVGRCLSYGEGITFWPLAEVLEQLAGRADQDAIAALMGDDEQGRWVAARLARAVGFASGLAPIEEIQLAVRRLFEAVARRRPLVVVIEDIHWAEPTLLDVLGHAIAHADRVPLFVVFLARPELHRRHGEWAVGETVRLGPLSDRDSRDLLAQLDPVIERHGDERTRVLAAAEGNPFFLEQMVAMQQETGAAGTIPATVQAVLAARIDALPEAERAVLECASVEGRRFHRDVVAELLPASLRDEIGDALVALVERDLVRPGRADWPHREGYRFSHILVRDEVYALMPKARRAELHERFARSLEARSVGQRELGEIVGFHFEQAYLCSTAVQPLRDATQQRLALAGSRHLGAVGRAALGRGDVPAAVNLLRRATVLLDDDEPALSWLLPDLGAALTQAGRLADAERVLEGAVRRAAARLEPRYEAHALVCLLLARLRTEVGSTTVTVVERFPDLLATFTAAGDDLGLDRLWRLRALVHWLDARSADAEAAWQTAVEHATRARDEDGRADALCWLASSAFLGPMPVLDGITLCEQIRAQLRDNRQAEAFVLQPLAALQAMRGEWATARRLLDESNALIAELGITMLTVFRYYAAFVALLADDPAEAELLLREGYEWLRDNEEKALLSDIVVMLARAVHAQGRLDAAFELTFDAEREADVHDISPRFGWRAVRAAIYAQRGELGEARRLADEAIALVAQTDWQRDHADTLLTRAEVLGACGEATAAAEALQDALTLYERKGCTVSAERVRTMLALHQTT